VRRGLQCNAPGGRGPPAGNGAHGPRVLKPVTGSDPSSRMPAPASARAGACARARERRDSESFGAGRHDQGGTGEVNDEKPRVKWSVQRIITFVILLLILALVIYLKVTGVV